MNYIFWLLPITVIGLIVYRLMPSKKSEQPQDNSPIKTTNKSGIAWVLIIMLIVGGGYYFLHGKKAIAAVMSENIVCPVSITPGMFNEMDLKDENNMAGFFYDKKFLRTEEVLDPDDPLNRRTVFRYILHDKDWYKSYGEFANIKEYAFATTKSDYVYYLFKNRGDYEKYIDYLKYLGADSLLPDNFENYHHLAGNHQSAKYKNRVFIEYGFNSADEGYLLGIFSADSLRPKVIDLPVTKKDTLTHPRRI